MVRHRSIGNLHRQYLRTKAIRKNSSAKRRTARSGTGTALDILPRRQYAVVPPLQTLRPAASASDSLPGLSVASLLLLAAPIEAARFIGHKLANTKNYVTPAFTGWVPRKYSVAAGTSPDWEETAWRARYVLPIVLLLFILSLLLFGFLNNPKGQPGKTVNKPVSITSIPVTPAKATGGKGGSGKGGGSSQPVSATSAQGTNTSGGSTSLGYTSISGGTTSGSGGGGTTGGMGGGPTGGGTGGGGSILPTCSLGQIATVTCVVTQCTPEVTLSSGQKAILGTDGTCIVLN